MTRVGLATFAALVLVACAPRGAPVPAAAFVDPGVRASQERACAAAIGARFGIPASSVQTRRASSDPSNWSIVNAYAGAASGYCRVDVNANVLGIVF